MRFFWKIYNYWQMLVRLYVIYIQFLFKYYAKCHLFIIRKAVSSHGLYFIYILFVLHGYFGQLGQQENEFYHFVSKCLVFYLKISSIEMFVVCRIPIAKNYLIKVFGQDYFVTNLPKSQLVFKYVSPIFFLLAIEIFTMTLRSRMVSYLHAACTTRYEQLHGFDALAWPDLVKQEYHTEQADILCGSCQGLTCAIADDITALVNCIMGVILNFL